MLRILETPEETAHRCIRELRESLARAGRPGIRYAEPIDGKRFSMTVVRAKAGPPAHPADDLPRELKKARASLQNAYRAIRALRDAESPEVWPADVVAWLDAQEIDPPNSIDTINHALRDLRTLKLASSHPDTGWRLDGSRLPTPNRQTAPPPAVAYASPVAATPARQFTRGASMSRQLIWVPGERSEYGVVITDIETDSAIAATERTGEIMVPTRFGRLCKTPAARGELIRTEGRTAVVRFPGGHTLTVKVLGEWQLKGLTAPEPEEADAAGVA